LEMGNSPNMIFSNYRELVSDEDANRWFSLVPQPTEEEKKEADSSVETAAV